MRSWLGWLTLVCASCSWLVDSNGLSNPPDPVDASAAPPRDASLPTDALVEEDSASTSTDAAPADAGADVRAMGCRAFTNPLLCEDFDQGSLAAWNVDTWIPPSNALLDLTDFTSPKASLLVESGLLDGGQTRAYFTRLFPAVGATAIRLTYDLRIVMQTTGLVMDHLVLKVAPNTGFVISTSDAATAGYYASSTLPDGGPIETYSQFPLGVGWHQVSVEVVTREPPSVTVRVDGTNALLPPPLFTTISSPVEISVGNIRAHSVGSADVRIDNVVVEAF